MNPTSESNVMMHCRNAVLPVRFLEENFEFRFGFTRLQVAEFAADYYAGELKRIETARKWLLLCVVPEQKNDLVRLLNDPTNFTLELNLILRLAPFLAGNQAIIGELKTGV
ncbi:MAG: hypothetical protein A2600_08855 [Candidatus Lambdaproteobacteria bacterium RIFOXYD1_FULL_56_27]|uniref:Uncharacterized protein n=1 Tax=Candidatus Lambdaproteobacteria bacterium RIFOXYD2_FULL_56_26 TaxID=1817773 RepID=A0A1F6GYV4_9PROT|nr:MAG: hypothetical protein A2426_10275 [Candidatus Lambdaproteobacteria bacterium RIFOXYC1_FULL_56_13]OGH03356.1 MAG: hypothetical protein A2557_02410 [Candidatus Lambdaproteobacteria bacterium RIFOXYD2_FULL_56_26]OGH06639.1 MAG: hypothetical protein A2600_08855 [Candidatus Lambdaproteobacteria bacterium RIFOXYD1_FULL_56_27]